MLRSPHAITVAALLIAIMLFLKASSSFQDLAFLVALSLLLHRQPPGNSPQRKRIAALLLLASCPLNAPSSAKAQIFEIPPVAEAPAAESLGTGSLGVSRPNSLGVAPFTSPESIMARLKHTEIEKEVSAETLCAILKTDGRTEAKAIALESAAYRLGILTFDELSRSCKNVYGKRTEADLLVDYRKSADASIPQSLRARDKSLHDACGVLHIPSESCAKTQNQDVIDAMATAIDPSDYPQLVIRLCAGDASAAQAFLRQAPSFVSFYFDPVRREDAIRTAFVEFLSHVCKPNDTGQLSASAWLAEQQVRVATELAEFHEDFSMPSSQNNEVYIPSPEERLQGIKDSVKRLFRREFAKAARQESKFTSSESEDTYSAVGSESDTCTASPEELMQFRDVLTEFAKFAEPEDIQLLALRALNLSTREIAFVLALQDGSDLESPSEISAQKVQAINQRVFRLRKRLESKIKAVK